MTKFNFLKSLIKSIPKVFPHIFLLAIIIWSNFLWALIQNLTHIDSFTSKNIPTIAIEFLTRFFIIICVSQFVLQVTREKTTFPRLLLAFAYAFSGFWVVITPPAFLSAYLLSTPSLSLLNSLFSEDSIIHKAIFTILTIVKSWNAIGYGPSLIRIFARYFVILCVIQSARQILGSDRTLPRILLTIAYSLSAVWLCLIPAYVYINPNMAPSSGGGIGVNDIVLIVVALTGFLSAISGMISQMTIRRKTLADIDRDKSLLEIEKQKLNIEKSKFQLEKDSNKNTKRRSNGAKRK